MVRSSLICHARRLITSNGDWIRTLRNDKTKLEFWSNDVVYDVQDRDCEQRTVLHAAAILGHPNHVDYIVQSGAVVDALDWSQSTPLHYAAMYGHLRVVQLLLFDNADFDATNYFGNTPLHNAARHQHARVIAELRAWGADPYILNRALHRYSDYLKK